MAKSCNNGGCGSSNSNSLPNGMSAPNPNPGNDGRIEESNITLPLDDYEMMKAQLIELDFELTRLLSQPTVWATVVKGSGDLDLKAFAKDERVLVLDEKCRKKKRFYGKIASNSVSEDGFISVEYLDGKRDRLNIGLNGQIPQVKLVSKNDGTNCVIAVDGKICEVHGLPGKTIKATENVKVNMQTMQIHDVVGETAAGEVVFVKDIVDETHVEVEANGSKKVVIHPKDMKIEDDDRLMLDSTGTMAVRVLKKADSTRYTTIEQSITWDEIAGLEDVKEAMQEALELPYKSPEIYKFYGKKPPKGVLLYGPPGCGKTLTAKASAASLAKTHGSENFQSGFIYVKGPELLSKWVGEAEQNVRTLFSRGREHYKKHGYPALLFIDEAEALLRTRGTGKSSDIEDTIVPMFLSEMDGLQDNHVIVLLATNQQKMLDPAVIREGRCDRHIRVTRPTLRNSGDYFNIHMKDLPLAKGVDREELIAIAAAELFAEHRVMYKLTHRDRSEIFRLGNAVSGSMIAGLVDHASSMAMKRDMKSGKRGGVTVDDFKTSINTIYKQHSNLNAMFDLEDFCDVHGFTRNETKIEKLILS